jgi:uncharacterized membrane protein
MMRSFYRVPMNGLASLDIISHILGMLIFVAFIAIIVIIIVRLIKRGNNPHQMHGGNGQRPLVLSAVEILDTRLAKGEITVEEYKVLKKEILNVS